MAEFLNLALGDYTDVASKVDLLGGALQLERGSWLPKSGAGGKPVTEVFDLVANDDNAAIIAELARIEELLEKARTWPINPVQSGGVWLEWGIEAEPRVSAEVGYAAKRAWVYGGELQIRKVKGMPGSMINGALVARLALTRHPVWENLEPVNDLYAAIAWGDVEDLTGLSEMGTAPGRIEQALLQYASANTVQEYWVGIRAVNEGWAEFDPLWELEDGTNGTDTSDAVDASASGGDKITCTFATETGLDERSSISTNEAHSGTTDWEDFIGRYLVLLRAKVGSSTECGIQLRYGAAYTGGQVPCEEVYIDNESWKLIELGEVMIPAGGYREGLGLGSGPWRYFTFALHAERLSGSGSLDMDCLYLIPAEHYVHGVYSDEDLTGLRMEVFTDPADGQTARMIKYTTDHTLFGDTAIRDWHLPVDLAFAVVAGQEVSEHDLTDTLELDLDWFPRWHLYREV